MLVETEELKTIAEIADHLPTKEGLGASTVYLYRLIQKGKISFEEVKIGKNNYYIIPVADQQKEDWGLGDKLKKE